MCVCVCMPYLIYIYILSLKKNKDTVQEQKVVFSTNSGGSIGQQYAKKNEVGKKSYISQELTQNGTLTQMENANYKTPKR